MFDPFAPSPMTRIPCGRFAFWTDGRRFVGTAEEVSAGLHGCSLFDEDTDLPGYLARVYRRLGLHLGVEVPVVVEARALLQALVDHGLAEVEPAPMLN